MLAYGVLRNIVLKHRKEFGFLLILGFAGFLCYSYMNEGRAGKVYSLNVDYEGPDLMDSFALVRNYVGKSSVDKLRIGDAIANPLDAEKAVEKLIKLEEETLSKAEAAVDGSLLDTKPGKCAAIVLCKFTSQARVLLPTTVLVLSKYQY